MRSTTADSLERSVGKATRLRLLRKLRRVLSPPQRGARRRKRGHGGLDRNPSAVGRHRRLDSLTEKRLTLVQTRAPPCYYVEIVENLHLEHDPEKWKTGFRIRSCSNKKSRL